MIQLKRINSALSYNGRRREMKYYLIFFIMMYATSVFAQEGPIWRSKPVQCGSAESALQIIQEADEKAIIGGFSNVRVENERQQHPFYLFINSETGTFTIIEYHLLPDEICVLGYGSGIDFDVQKYFEKKTGS